MEVIRTAFRQERQETSPINVIAGSRSVEAVKMGRVAPSRIALALFPCQAGQGEVEHILLGKP